MSKDTKSESNGVPKHLKSGDYLDGPDDPDFNDYGFVSPETNDFYRKYMATAPSTITFPTAPTKATKPKAASKQSKEAKKVPGPRTCCTTKAAYDPDEERKLKNKEIKPKIKRAQTAAPMDFQALLQLAEKNQHEPTKMPAVAKKQTPSRLLTAREKLELEDRARRQQERKLQAKVCTPEPQKPIADSQPVNPVTPKLEKTNPICADRSYTAISNIKLLRKKPAISTNYVLEATPEFLKAAAARRAVADDGSISKIVLELKSESKQQESADETDYDSDLDDFIDDSECQPDISSYIRNIFGYDKRKYSDRDMDDSGMESSYAQVQHEEQISKRLGLQEDLEDMRLEAMQKKMKMDRNKKK